MRQQHAASSVHEMSPTGTKPHQPMQWVHCGAVLGVVSGCWLDLQPAEASQGTNLRSFPPAIFHLSFLHKLVDTKLSFAGFGCTSSVKSGSFNLKRTPRKGQCVASGLRDVWGTGFAHLLLCVLRLLKPRSCTCNPVAQTVAFRSNFFRKMKSSG